MLIDSHSHLHFPAYKNDLAAVLERMKQKNVQTLTVGTSYLNSLEAVAFSKQYDIPCSVGFHPSHARPRPPLTPPYQGGDKGGVYLDPNEAVYDEEFDIEKLRSVILNSIQNPEKEESNKLSSRASVSEAWRSRSDASNEIARLDSRQSRQASQSLAMTREYNQHESASESLPTERVLAVGECGLDYFRLPEDEGLKKQFKEKQREAFEAQIELAQEFNLPLIVHTRASKEDPNDAYRDTLDVITRNASRVTRRGVMHCYLGNVEYAKKFLDLGFYLSFSGIVTFKKIDTVRESATMCPADRILSETDCPYLAPEPHRGKQNEPAFVEFVLRKLEEIRGEKLEERIERNFQNLFYA